MSHTRNSHLVDFNAGILTKESTPFASSDGTTTNRAIVYGPFDVTYNPRGWLASAAVLEVTGWVDIPTSNPSANIFLFSLSSVIGGFFEGTDNSLLIRIDLNGQIRIRANSTTGSSNWRGFDFNNFRTTYSGQRIFLRIIITQGTSNPVVWVNGINISSQFTASTAGTPPNWLDANLNSTYHLVGFNWPSGNLPVIVPILGSMTEAEALSVRTTGVFPAWVFTGGSRQDVKPISGSFITWFGTGSVTSSTPTQVVIAAGSSGLYVRSPVLTRLPPPRSRIKFNLTVSGLTGAGTIGVSTFTISSETSIVNSTSTDYVVEARTEGQVNVIISATSTTEVTITINSVEILGSLQLPSVNPTQVISDATVIGNNSGLLVGGSTQCSCREGEFTNVISWNGTHEAKRLFGTSGRVHNGNIRILSIVTKATVASSGSGLTIGTTTSNNRYVTANTFATAKKVHTLAADLPASTAANDCDFVIDPDTNNYTGAITVTIRYEMLSFNV